MANSSTSSRMGLVVGASLLMVAALFVSNAPSGLRMFGHGEHYSKVGQSVVDKVRDLAALTTVEVVESTTIDKGNDFGWLNWARGDRVFMFVVAKIGAGIDFEQFYTESFEVDTESGTVFVQMPSAQITYVAIDNVQTQVIDRDTGLFTKGDPKLESDARQVAEQVLRNAAIEAGILERAQKNARTIIEGLLLELGYTRVVFGRDQRLPESTSRDRGAFDDDHRRIAAVAFGARVGGRAAREFHRVFVAMANNSSNLARNAAVICSGSGTSPASVITPTLTLPS